MTKHQVAMQCVWLIVLFVISAGCGRLIDQSLQQKMGWQAQDFFDDPQVIALCEAIEAEDLEEMEQLINAGADVNATGMGSMTPLLWAFFDNKLPRFKLLLEHGADPNVYVTTDLGDPKVVSAGDTVTHMASETSFPGYFEAVFANGGDPNLRRKTKSLGTGETPIFRVLRGPASEKASKVQTLVKLGADLDCTSDGATPAITAASLKQYRVALKILNLGGDHRVYIPRTNTRLIHVVVMKEFATVPVDMSDPARLALLKWLEDHGESVEQARKDIERWHMYMDTSTTTEEYALKMEAEIRDRKRRDAQEKEAAEEKAEAGEEVGGENAIETPKTPGPDGHGSMGGRWGVSWCAQ